MVGIISKPDSVQKLQILSAEAQYDLACACGTKEEAHRKQGADGRWIYPVTLPNGGKKYTPALTVPQVRMILYVLLRQACDRRYPGWARRYIKRKSKRRELARFYHYKRHKLLAPLRVKERK